MSRIMHKRELAHIILLKKRLNKELFSKSEIDFSNNAKLISFLEKNIDYISEGNDRKRRYFNAKRNKMMVRKIKNENAYIINIMGRKKYSFRGILTKQYSKSSFPINPLFFLVRILQALKTTFRVVIDTTIPSGLVMGVDVPAEFHPELKWNDERKTKLWQIYFNKFDYYILKADGSDFKIKKLDHEKFLFIKLAVCNEFAYIPPKVKWNLTFHNYPKYKYEQLIDFWRKDISEVKKEVKNIDKDS